MTGKGQKPQKPYPDFPLTPHKNGQWVKRIRKKLFYFGPWADWRAALAEYQRVRDDLHAGRKPRPKTADVLTMRELVNRFYRVKEDDHEAGRLAPRTLADYRAACGRLTAQFGKDRAVTDLDSADFEALRRTLSASLGPAALGVEIVRIRMVFRYGYESGLLERPVRFGPAFRRPSAKELRKVRASKPARMFEAEEVRQLLDAATQPLKSMILLGVNCALGNGDCARLEYRHVRAGWLDYPRPKTGVARRCPLWPETVASLLEAMAARPFPLDPAHEGTVFLTSTGRPWRQGPSFAPVTAAFTTLLDRTGLRMEGRGFYALRHSFATIAGGTADQVAVNAVMGHVDASVVGMYRERVEDIRLRRVTDHVRAWLWPDAK